MRLAMPKKRPCSRCRVAREMMVKGEVANPRLCISLKWLCVPCLMEMMGLLDGKKFLYKEALKKWPEEEK